LCLKDISLLLFGNFVQIMRWVLSQAHNRKKSSPQTVVTVWPLLLALRGPVELFRARTSALYTTSECNERYPGRSPQDSNYPGSPTYNTVYGEDFTGPKLQDTSRLKHLKQTAITSILIPRLERTSS
jgi:hypothetical protein